jgi:hypothetical protein
MATSDKEQQSILVRQHKRIAQGVKLDGTSMTPKGESNKSGGLSSKEASKKK